jgi:hypothetical protein
LLSLACLLQCYCQAYDVVQLVARAQTAAASLSGMFIPVCNPPTIHLLRPDAQVVTSKLVKLGAKSSQAGAPAEVIIRRRRRSRSASGTPTESWEMVRARGHHDEVLNLTGARRDGHQPAPCYLHVPRHLHPAVAGRIDTSR